jgi:hypothetical protein
MSDMFEKYGKSDGSIKIPISYSPNTGVTKGDPSTDMPNFEQTYAHFEDIDDMMRYNKTVQGCSGVTIRDLDYLGGRNV